MADFIEILAQQTEVLALIAVVVGVSVGSFLNVVIMRLPKMMQATWQRDCVELLRETAPAHPGGAPDESLVSKDSSLSLSAPPSTCPHCGHRIRAYENIPILSYLLLGGRCSNCKALIGLRYPLVEGLTALLTLAVALQFGMSWQLPAALLLTWALIALALIDYDHQLLPDSITLPLLWLGLLLSLFDIFTDSHAALIGAIAGYLSLWTVFQLFRLLTGKEGMGYGDFKLLAMFGAWLGWQLLPQIVLMATVAGASYGVLLLITGQQQRAQPLPFGPFLAIAGWISLLWGDAINAAYLQVSGLS
ncbi:prepilin peptidase [Chromatium okenii]|uniref:A24 family peptidase n=1 Tax=Chromatium okenii TaxID=61644 RepID=UPI0019036AEA|nr:A24 family peptidase [Chromatium okenii]MBK1640652.1 prepilin peptidase [Chromatium okenii]